ncbi:tryptophan synthase subunit alpha [Prochlorococcus marinus XMU1419]|uniref:tryptophan synthase subunit alpha n=1 Tax=Prochlorococcus marinus TaxID=1219 RepID=UPI001ADA9EC3|nr:tryptophan synthase subunit alpha [Prochlorococcus marinus]MBO8233482.1 tryptophan synthase subunit alpha [Prochlorococcus marinus XMU1419]MBW3076962.1 tryptophan synthase subunit alpha [Prochlorococcus marinus str. XMU1419]
MKEHEMKLIKNNYLSKVDEKFYNLKSNNKLALMPFIMAGDPNVEITSEILLKLQDNGADLIELGIPYSDPLADGPTIQLSASRALKAGTTPRKVITLLDSLKGKLNIPIVLFSYLNPLLCFGFEEFCEMASNAGVSGLIIPDLPLEEAYKFSNVVRTYSMDLILLVAPTTPFERMEKISNYSKGFTYLVSVTGVTGERNKMENRVENLINKLKQINNNPIAVGFGISTPEHINKVREWGADGVIIGSAFVKRISSSSEKDVVDQVGKFCKDMRLAADQKN